MTIASKLIDAALATDTLRKLASHGGDFFELYVENTLESNFVYEDNRIEEIISGTDSGIGLRLIDDLKSLYGFTNDIQPASVLQTASSLANALNKRCNNASFNFKSQKPLHHIHIQQDPFILPHADKVALCKKANDMAWAASKHITQVEIRYHEARRITEIFNSLGEQTFQNQTHVSLIFILTAQIGDDMHSSAASIAGTTGFELFTEAILQHHINKCAHQAIQNIRAPRVDGGKMPVVISSEAGGTLIHEAVGHSLEGDLVADNMSQFANKLGQQVASPILTVIDDATLKGNRGSFEFDDEGVPGQRKILIENGILKSFMMDRLSAMKLGHRPTGNGRRQSYEYRPIVRMTNTYIDRGTDTPEDIVKSVDHGLFVKDMGGGQVNTVNGDFVFDCTEAYMIKNGKIDKPVKKATLIGNGGTILQTIDRVGHDLTFASGTCGKDDQGAPVSDAIPTIRIPSITVGGEIG